MTAVEEALRLHPTWINGGGDLPGPGGSVIAAMLAVASGLCRHVLCFRTVWESTYADARARTAAAAVGGVSRARCTSGGHRSARMSAANWIGMNANQYLHRYGATPRDARLDRASTAAPTRRATRPRSTATR